ncbi:MAG: hypothetical protein F6K39_06230 [Okeania sp. SIO3B3]|nr:hypothetical protein [Okeania sp. SIO3B3]
MVVLRRVISVISYQLSVISYQYLYNKGEALDSNFSVMVYREKEYLAWEQDAPTVLVARIITMHHHYTTEKFSPHQHINIFCHSDRYAQVRSHNS